MKLWKVLGVAGVAGVAATGAVVVRAERRRRAWAPEDVRARLRERHAEAVERAATAEPPAGGEEEAPGWFMARWVGLRGRLRQRDR